VDLDPKIVITTNIDHIYETYCKNAGSDQGCNHCNYYDTHALNDIRSTLYVILTKRCLKPTSHTKFFSGALILWHGLRQRFVSA
jgi:hypothetical protein